MTTEIIETVRKAVKAYNQPYGFESLDFTLAMSKLEALTKDGYCSEGDGCNCRGDCKGVMMSCSRWVK